MQYDIYLQNQRVYLRNVIEEDIERYVRWHTVEVEWQKWDAPWEAKEEGEVLRERILQILARPKPEFWIRLQLCTSGGQHIGSVSTYFIDDQNDQRAIGIDIPEKSYWGQGLGEEALKLWMAYLFTVTPVEALYCETWSGNTRMTRLAEKCGFKENRRRNAIREVDGKLYDALCFKVGREEFWAANEGLWQNVVHVDRNNCSE